MSSLKDFVRHELNEMPGPAPKPPVPPARAKNEKPLSEAARAQARQIMKGALYYTQAEAHASTEGWVESDETVASKLRSKEEFPQG